MTEGKTVSDFGEKRLIREIITPICSSQDIPIGIGDDAAMIHFPPGKNLLISTDKTPEDLLAIKLGLMDAYHHGRYLATINISDIAAMGGEPTGLLMTLALTNDFPVNYLKDFCQGFVDGGKEWNVPVIGGDLGSGTVPCLSATVVGFIDANNVLTRSKANEGDDVFVTGPVGGFNTALLYFVKAKPEGFRFPSSIEDYLRTKLILPKARVKVGKLLARSGLCTSCMDITDGVGRTIFELSESSNKSFVVQEESLPIHEATYTLADYLKIEPYEILFGIGLDLELMGTVSSLNSNIGKYLHLIGKVKKKGQNLLKRKSGELVKIPSFGWEHFSGSPMDMVNAYLLRHFL